MTETETAVSDNDVNVEIKETETWQEETNAGVQTKSISGNTVPEGTPANPVHNCNTEDGTQDTTTWSYVYFGSYPQSEVTDSTIISAIDNTISSGNGVTAYAGTDVWVNGTKYRRISISDTNYDGHFDEVTNNGYRYFKWERIKWRVLKNDENTSKTESYPAIEEAEKQITSTNTDKGDVAGSKFYKLRLKATGKNKSIKLTWKKVKDADGYIIYGAKCGKSMKKIKTLKGNTKTSYTQKKPKKGKYYKYIVVAYKNIDGKKCTIATSKSAHAVTNGGKYGNPTKVTVKASKMTIKKGSKKTIKASYTLPKGKKASIHIAKFRYESTNTKVATVAKKVL